MSTIFAKMVKNMEFFGKQIINVIERPFIL
jgi:hypothetical protein